jgi:hypothetical protein
MPLSSVVGAQSIVKPGVCTSTTKPASPYDGQVIYMTDVDQTAVWDGTSWVGLDPSRDRNVIINGAMQVAQRGTSTASITATGYYTADRWFTNLDNTAGTWTQSVEADAPTGSGLRKSIKMLCTTANSSLDANDFLNIDQRIEGQNLQQFLKGTASAKPFTVSFWVKSNVTGTYIAELRDVSNTRAVSASYTISVSATWEKKTITFPADTTGAFANDNSGSLRLGFGLAMGSTYASGTLATTWVSITQSNRYAGQTNLSATLNNYWQITGVQLEAGAVATPFEFENIGETLAKCQRYYQKSYADAVVPLTAGDANGLVYASSYNSASQGHSIGQIIFQVPFRSAPTVTIYGYNPSTAGAVSNVQGTNLAAGSGNTQFITTKSANVWNNSGGTITPNLGGYLFHYVASAEL